MPDDLRILASILLAGAITWGLRAAPFALLAPLRDSELLANLGRWMPAGIMLILVVHTLGDLDPTSVVAVGPVAASLAVTVGLHLWRRSLTLSIFAGTAVHVALASGLALAG